MSDLASTNKASSVTESLPGAAELGARGQSPVRPIKIWAAPGAALLAFQLYVWTRWVTGPFFQRVPAGPSEPPLFMKVPLMANAVILWLPCRSPFGGSSSGRGDASAESPWTAC